MYTNGTIWYWCVNIINGFIAENSHYLCKSRHTQDRPRWGHDEDVRYVLDSLPFLLYSSQQVMFPLTPLLSYSPC